MSRLSFVIVDSRYCDYLRAVDPCVPYTMDRKANRPFVGVLLQIKDLSYYAPLSSPKPKHLKMGKQVDAIKIDNGRYGIINLNNMIPIHENSVSAIDAAIYPTDTYAEVQYKTLLGNQLSWCNANKTVILSKASTLYRLITNHKAWDGLTKRCCDFAQDEVLLRQYCLDNGWVL